MEPSIVPQEQNCWQSAGHWAVAGQDALEIASRNGMESIAFPCISTGVYGYPAQKAAETAVGTVYDYIKNHDSNINVIFCCFRESDAAIYNSLLNIIQDNTK